MSKSNQPYWMLSPKGFISLLGAEYHLMRETGVLKRFYVSSVLILVTLLLTWISVDYAIGLLFHTLAIEITLAIFFCLVFFCIYIFILNTFAKENRERKGLLNLSNIIRIGFVVFMAFLIAQPLAVLVYANALSPAVETYKQHIYNEHASKIEALVKVEMTNLVNKEAYYKEQRQQFGATAYNNELNKISERLKILRTKTTILNRTAEQIIAHNSFFLFRIQKINRKFPLSWLLTFFIILLFFMPGYLIYTIPSQHEYYRLKKDQEKELVTAAYNEFTARYTSMFNEPVALFSRYEDPPFNTKRKQRPVPASMTDFLKKYIGNG